MSETSVQIIAAARKIAQDATETPLVCPLDLSTLLAVALREFDGDRPNHRIVLYTIPVASFRFVLAGTGAIVSGLNAWTAQQSRMDKVWYPYNTATQGRAPLDAAEWDIYDEPTQTVLEFLNQTPAPGAVVRLDFYTPHAVHAANASLTTVLSTDLPALHLLTAAYLLEAFAAKALQNTGSTGIPADVVDRRTPSDQARSVAKAFRERYGRLVGRPSKDDPPTPLSSVGDYDIRSSFAGGFLFKPRSSR